MKWLKKLLNKTNAPTNPRVLTGKGYSAMLRNLDAPIVIDLGYGQGSSISGNKGNGYIHLRGGWAIIDGERVNGPALIKLESL